VRWLSHGPDKGAGSLHSENMTGESRGVSVADCVADTVAASVAVAGVERDGVSIIKLQTLTQPPRSAVRRQHLARHKRQQPMTPKRTASSWVVRARGTVSQRMQAVNAQCTIISELILDSY
jgi:hypothetical protein